MASAFDDLLLGSAGVIDLLSQTASRATGGFLPETFLAAEVWANQTAVEKNLSTDQRNVLAEVATQETKKGALDTAAKQTQQQVTDYADLALPYVKWGLGGMAVVAGLFLGVKAYQGLKTAEGH